MNRKPGLLQLFYVLLFLSVFYACDKNKGFNTDPDFSLTFSQDTIIFDTVFTTIGSTTHSFTVHNTSSQRVKIDYIALAEGSESAYKINIDGEGTDRLDDVEIAAGDSLYIFVEVRVNPTNQNNPLIITDSILFQYNGKQQDVDLVAWGQDAHFIVGDANYGGFTYLGNHYSAFGEIVAHENEVVDWYDDKPYVVYGFAIIDSAAVLNIHEGVNVYFHKNSGIWAYKGAQLNVLGTKDSIVRFTGDRLESFYYDAPGQWFGVFLNESPPGHSFEYLRLRNSVNGIHYEPLDITDAGENQSLKIQNTIVENNSYTSLFAMGGKILAANSVFAKAGVYTVFLGGGGSYDFRHCTLDNHWSNGVRSDPSIVISDHLITNDLDGNTVTYLGDLENAYFGNCILYGTLDDELAISHLDGANTLFNYHFDHSLLRTTSDVSDENLFSACVINKDPLFTDVIMDDYSLDTIVSPVIDKGALEVVNESQLPLNMDITGNSRIDDDAPDMGAYEFIEE